MRGIWRLVKNFNRSALFSKQKISFDKAGVLNALVSDYLNGKEALRPYFNSAPTPAGIAGLLAQHPYADFDYTALFEIAQQQSKKVNNTSTATQANITLLGSKGTYTITTGHQLCLFTGPLYFIYKIISTINLAEALQKAYPSAKFVPVYWMASEDHDFEEVASFNLFGKNIRWQSTQSGAVGDFETAELAGLLPQVKEVFGTMPYAEELANLFEKAYCGQGNLADATRYLVNALFGDYGLVVIDGNDPLFKRQFVDVFKKDLFEQLPFLKTTESIDALTAMGYSAQVNPRQINSFYLEKGKRLRIEKNGEDFQLVNGNRNFSKEEMLELVERQPEKLSPNVVLRPLYQQRILPNLAYVGGPGELAYWLEYKRMFDAHGLLFPALVPRNFVMVLDKTTHAKISKLGFEASDVFESELELVARFQQAQNAVFDLDTEKERVSEVYAAIVEKITATDKSLAGSAQAELQKALNGLDGLSGKANKALKQKLDTEINQIKTVKQKLFPTGTPQERFDNFSLFYLKHGRGFIDYLKENLEAADKNFTIFTEAISD